MLFDCEKYILETKYDALRKRGSQEQYEVALPKVRDEYTKLYKDALDQLREDRYASPILFGIVSNYAVFLYELEDVELKEEA